MKIKMYMAFILVSLLSMFCLISADPMAMYFGNNNLRIGFGNDCSLNWKWSRSYRKNAEFRCGTAGDPMWIKGKGPDRYKIGSGNKPFYWTGGSGSTKNAEFRANQAGDLFWIRKQEDGTFAIGYDNCPLYWRGDKGNVKNAEFRCGSSISDTFWIKGAIKPTVPDIPPAKIDLGACHSQTLQATNHHQLTQIAPKQRSELPSFSYNTVSLNGKVIKELTFVGQTVYMSDVYHILKEGKYPPSKQFDPKKEFHMIIKSDRFYCDERIKRSGESANVNIKEYKIPGLTKFQLVARHIESISCILNFEHDVLVKEIKNGKNGISGVVYGQSGKNGDDGSAGANGIDGTQVTIAHITGKGALQIKIRGSDGTKGGDGGSGGDGFRGKSGRCGTSCCCNHVYCPTSFVRVESNGNGGRGGDAGAAGKPGNGGAAGLFSLVKIDAKSTGLKMEISGCSGRVGGTGKAGKPGNGAASGSYGTTRACKGEKWGFQSSCTNNGRYVNCPRQNGAKGANGNTKTVLKGVKGATFKTDPSQSKEKFKKYFDDTLQQLAIFHAEQLYLEGKPDEAKVIFEIVKSLATETANIAYAGLMIGRISSGLNYFGYMKNQYLSIGLTTTDKDIKHLLEAVTNQAQNINTLLKYISTKDVLINNRQLFKSSMLIPARNELKEVEKKILFEQSLKEKAIQIMGKMEFHMGELAEKMEKDLQASIDARRKKNVLKVMQLALTLFGAFISFGGAKTDDNKIEKFGAASAILGGAQDILGFVVEESFRAKKGRMCNTNFKKMKAFAENMMKIDVVVPQNPLKTDFTKLQSTATAELLKVQALEKRDDLLLAFKCLIEYVGFAGDTLEGTIGAYFDYSFSRLNVMGQAIQHDINLKQFQFKKQRIEATITGLNSALAENKLGSFNPALQKARLLFKDRMIAVFTNIERDALQALYKKATALKFSTLWDPMFMDSIQTLRRSQHTAVGDVYFNSHLYLQEVDRKLKTMECKFRNCMSQSGVHVIRDNAYLWIYTPGNNKKLFEGIWTNGIGSFTIGTSGICHTIEECVNLRLLRLYVEVRGDKLFDKQNSVVRVEVTHSGQNVFYLPPKGKQNATFVQTKSKLVHININTKQLSQTTCPNNALSCNVIFPNHVKPKDMCTLTASTPFEQLFGTEPCRSVFSEYTVNLPRTDTAQGSITKNNKFFDWKKVKEVKVFAAVRAFKNYPTKDQCNQHNGCKKK